MLVIEEDAGYYKYARAKKSMPVFISSGATLIILKRSPPADS
jgi:hypothetical protein